MSPLRRPAEKTGLARDTVFAAVMIVCNGIVGLCLLMGGVRHHEQGFQVLIDYCRQSRLSALRHQLPIQCAAGSMPLFLMSDAASGADMNLTKAVAASRCFETANTPAENTT